MTATMAEAVAATVSASGPMPAVVLGIDTPIGLVPHPRLGHVHAAAPEGRAATTHIRVLAARDGRAIVEALAAEGTAVAFCARDAAEIAATEREIRKLLAAPRTSAR